MRLVLSIGLLLSNTSLFAADMSGLSTHLGSYNPDGSFSIAENVFMVIVDPLGRETGHNPFANTWKRDIPYSGSGSDTIDDDETGSPGPADFGVHITESLISGKYEFKIFGLSDVQYFLDIGVANSVGNGTQFKFKDYISSGTTSLYALQYNSTPGAPVPVITKTVTFDTLRQDLTVAQKLNQIGDDKFVNSLTRMVNLAEKLAGKCDKHKRDKKCRPAIAVLNMVIKRLEAANRKCDSKNPKACGEDKDWEDFGIEHREDRDYDDFFRDWGKDDWHKWKKECKRFVSDEALKIIKEDAQWLIKSLGGEIDRKRDNHDGGKEKE